MQARQSLESGRVPGGPRGGNARRMARAAQACLLFGFMALLSACANGPGGSDMTVPVAEEAAYYRSHARTYYQPPGPPEDPWGPYVQEASRRFDVPEEWVRAVIQQESGGRLFHNGQLVTSGPGAMGLMQLMPPTYDEMRSAYNLGGDAYEPHDNIMAGTAYIRQLYDVYGSPGFLAAYNAGPGRLEDFITHNRTLPRETRNYVASIGRRIAGISPTNRSQADLLVASHDSLTQSSKPVQVASQTQAVRAAWSARSGGQPVRMADAIGGDENAASDDTSAVSQAPSGYGREWHAVPRTSRIAGLAETPSDVSAVWAKRLGASQQSVADTPLQVAQAPETAADPAPVQPESHTLRLFPAAQAEPAPLLTRKTRGQEPRDWAIQVGAFGSVSLAQHAAGEARNRATQSLGAARPQVATVQVHNGKLYRARLTNLSHTQALDACRKLSGCMVIAPDSSS